MRRPARTDATGDNQIMSESSRTTLFADRIIEAHVVHGVARLTLAQTGLDGEPMPSGQLVIPLVQLPAIAKGLRDLLRQVEAHMKEAQGKTQSSSTADGNGNGDGKTSLPPSVPGVFRFKGTA